MRFILMTYVNVNVYNIKLHSFMQIYIMIIAWIHLKCKSYVLHIKT
jgi:hypothetical protein